MPAYLGKVTQSPSSTVTNISHYCPPHAFYVTKPYVLDKLRRMAREISAGGVVVDHSTVGWQVAVIEPQKGASVADSRQRGRKKWQKMLLALPKGLVDQGEKPEQTAVREVREETGLSAVPLTKLGDIKYVYVRSWGDRERVFKIVSFYLLRYVSGKIDDISPEMRIEVKRALWVPLEQAALQLAYKGEKDMVRRALQYLDAHPGLEHAG
jgi:8-oxo-dGTP pyrophosphatase MutT (NUDIX family)